MYSIVQRCACPSLSDDQRQELLTQAQLVRLAELFETVLIPVDDTAYAMISHSCLPAWWPPCCVTVIAARR